LGKRMGTIWTPAPVNKNEANGAVDVSVDNINSSNICAHSSAGYLPAGRQGAPALESLLKF
jgi:hypothetical protein